MKIKAIRPQEIEIDYLEDLELLLECSKTIKNRLERLVREEGLEKYREALNELDFMISEYRAQLVALAIAA